MNTLSGKEKYQKSQILLDCGCIYMIAMIIIKSKTKNTRFLVM